MGYILRTIWIKWSQHLGQLQKIYLSSAIKICVFGWIFWPPWFFLQILELSLYLYCKHMKSADLICAKFLRLSLYTLGWRWWCTVLCVSSGFDLHEAHHVKRWNGLNPLACFWSKFSKRFLPELSKHVIIVSLKVETPPIGNLRRDEHDSIIHQIFLLLR